MLITAILQRRVGRGPSGDRALHDRSSTGCGTLFAIAACRRGAKVGIQRPMDCKVVARNSVGHPGNVGLGYFRHRAFDLRRERAAQRRQRRLPGFGGSDLEYKGSWSATSSGARRRTPNSPSRCAVSVKSAVE